VTGRIKTEVREKLKKLQAEAAAGLKTLASYTERVIPGSVLTWRRSPWLGDEPARRAHGNWA
jgi:hypothetical protein